MNFFKKQKIYSVLLVLCMENAYCPSSQSSDDVQMNNESQIPPSTSKKIALQNIEEFINQKDNDIEHVLEVTPERIKNRNYEQNILQNNTLNLSPSLETRETKKVYFDSMGEHGARNTENIKKFLTKEEEDTVLAFVADGGLNCNIKNIAKTMGTDTFTIEKLLERKGININRRSLRSKNHYFPTLNEQNLKAGIAFGSTLLGKKKEQKQYHSEKEIPTEELCHDSLFVIPIEPNTQEYQCAPKDFMRPMAKNTHRIDKKERICFLKNYKVPVEVMANIVQESTAFVTEILEQEQEYHSHDFFFDNCFFDNFAIPQSLPEKNLEKPLTLPSFKGLSFTNLKTDQPEIIPYNQQDKSLEAYKTMMTVMPHDATNDQIVERILLLLRHNLLISEIMKIVGKSYQYIREIEERNNLTPKPNNNFYLLGDNELMVEQILKDIEKNKHKLSPAEREGLWEIMPKGSSEAQIIKRIILLFQNGEIRACTIGNIVHKRYDYVKEVGRKINFPVRESRQSFRLPDDQQALLVPMAKNASIEEKERRVLALLQYNVPVRRIETITRRDRKEVTKIALANNMPIRK